MTEIEWNLKRENLTLKIELIKTQDQLLQTMHAKTLAELQAMGEQWIPPDSEQKVTP